MKFFQLNSSDAATNLFTGIVVQRCIVDDCLQLGNDDWQGSLVEGCVFTSSGPNTTGGATTSNIINGNLRNNRDREDGKEQGE